MMRCKRSNRGMALVTAIITSAVLITLAGASLMYSRSDVMVSDNARHGSSALWIAQLGNERAKNALRASGWWRFVAANGLQTVAASGTTYPGIPGATYATTVAPYPAGGLPSTTGKFLLDTTATAPDGTTSRVQEVVALAGANLALDAINLQGTGTHAKLEETGIGIPKYFVDARNHDRNGVVCGADSSHCPTPAAVAAFAGTAGTVNTDLQSEITNLQQKMVASANGCGAPGSCDGPKQAGLYWMKHFTNGNPQALSSSNCNAGDPWPCYRHLDLLAPELNATSHPNGALPSYPTDTTWAEMFRGPFAGSSLSRINSTSQDQALQDAIVAILEFAMNSEVGDRGAITSNLTTNQSWGSWEGPKIVLTCDTSFSVGPGGSTRTQAIVRRLSAEPPCNGNNAPNDVKIQSNAVVTGTGILILTRTLQLDDARFNWRGIVLVLDQGRLQIKIGGNPDIRGMILGTVVLQDENGSDPKIKFIGLGAANPFANPFFNAPPPPSTPPSIYGTIYGFGVKFSAESIENALTPGMVTVAWHEVYEGEESL